MDERLHGRRTGEDDGVRPAPTEFGGLGGVSDRILLCPVDFQGVHDRQAPVAQDAWQLGGVEVPGDHEHLLVLDVMLFNQLLSERARVGLGGGEVRLEMVAPQLTFGRRPYAGEAGSAHGADVREALKEAVEEPAHAVRAGEDDPVVLADAVEHLGEHGVIRFEADGDEGQFRDRRAGVGERGLPVGATALGPGQHHQAVSERGLAHRGSILRRISSASKEAAVTSVAGKGRARCPKSARKRRTAPSA